MTGAASRQKRRLDNRLDHAAEAREVWHNFWDTRLTYQKSYFARLNYMHQNPVKHGLVPVANQYPWCSARWLERTASAAKVRSIYRFKIEGVHVSDDFETGEGLVSRSPMESGAGARALQDLSAPRLRGWNAKRLGVRNAVPPWKAALARARSKTCRRPGCGDGTRSVLECGTQFRFGKRRWRARAPRPVGAPVAGWNAKRLGVRNAVPLWKAALARARPRPVGAPVAGMERESVLECGTQFRLGKRRWRARAPRPVGAPVAGMERESVLECGTQFRLGKRRWRARAPRPAGISDAPGETRKRLGVSGLRAGAGKGYSKGDL